jgi:hypothetical protein
MRLREKKSEKFFMTEKVYHIYAKDKCIYHSLCREEFEIVWDSLNKFVEIFSEYHRADLEYEEVTKNANVIRDSSY